MKILVFGSNGFVGKSIIKNLNSSEDKMDIIASTREDTNLFSLKETSEKIKKENAEVVINAAARVGGIYANNTQRFKFILDNLKININIFEALSNFPETKFINIGTSSIYPLGVENPIKEESLMTGKLEPTNSPYSMAKLTSIELGKSLHDEIGSRVLNIMPTNLYGPNDHFEKMNSHVIPGLIYKMHKAVIENSSSVEIWGSGSPLREFMHVDDLSSAIIFLLNKETKFDILNIGTGEEVTIKNLANKIKQITGFNGELVFNESFPDGNPRKLLDSSKINKLGWFPKITLENGLRNTFEWYKKNI